MTDGGELLPRLLSTVAGDQLLAASLFRFDLRLPSSAALVGG